jgi:hypothetical protein
MKFEIKRYSSEHDQQKNHGFLTKRKSLNASQQSIANQKKKIEEVEKNYFYLKKSNNQNRVQIVDPRLKKQISEVYFGEELNHDEPEIPTDVLCNQYNNMRTMYGVDHPGMNRLLDTLNNRFGERITNVPAIKKSGFITFDQLTQIFSMNSHIVGFDQYGSEQQGYLVKRAGIERGFFGPFLCIICRHLTTNGAKVIWKDVELSISHFKGHMKINDLPYQLVDSQPGMMERLKKRGGVFRSIATGYHYKMYNNDIIQKRGRWEPPVRFSAHGRIMIDSHNCRKFLPSHYNDCYYVRDDCIETITDDIVWLAPTRVGAFSFKSKKWGDISVSNLSEIQFDDGAYDQLVMTDERKFLVNSLINHSHGQFNDFIKGKGEGCIFLLDGPPGVGKTLTCESIAEKRHQPLYSVSIGELGTNVNDLDCNLNQILEVASCWNAVLLIDEADIFLEKRTNSDVKRNAMTAVFLRSLEYYNGTMFLTTNRIQSIDPAFHSRISMTLHYNNLDATAKAKIWNQFLSRTGLDASSIDIAKVSEYNMNGRQIKNTVRILSSMANARGVTKLDPADIDMCMKHNGTINEN